jgi:hypothetical protein
MDTPAFRENARYLSLIKLSEELEDEDLIGEDGVLSNSENVL